MDRFNFNRDFYEGCRALGPKEGAALAWAMLCYGYDGEEPDRLRPAAAAAFAFARGRIDAMVNGSRGGRAKGSRGGTQGGMQGSAEPKRQAPTAQKEKEKEITLTGYGEGQATPAPEPPAPDEFEAYFAANCLRGDAGQFLDHYAAQGWTLPNGRPVSDWRALARNWARRQVGFDAERKARGGQTSQEVERAATWRPAASEDEEIARLEAELGEGA